MARVYLDYTIHLNDQAEVELRQTQRSRFNKPTNNIGGTLQTVSLFGVPVTELGKLYCSPERALAEYGGSIVRVGGLRPAEPPFYTSTYLISGSSDRMPSDEDVFERTVGGWFGIGFLFGDTTQYVWRGTYKYEPDNVPFDGGDILAPDTIRQRRWIDGFETPENGAGSSGGESAFGRTVSRDASRHPDGFGLRVVAPPSGSVTHSVSEFRAGLAPTSSWERIYLRVNTRPTAPFEFWRCTHLGSAAGLGISVLPSGALGLYDITIGGVRNLMGTTEVLDLARFYRLDSVFGTGSAVAGGFWRFYIGRALKLSLTGLPAFGVVGTHGTSQAGCTQGSSLGVSLDLDDWICADAATDVANNLSLDWLNGSRVKFIKPTAFGPGHDAANWGANKTARQLGQRPARDIVTSINLASVLAGSILEVEMDVVDQVAEDPKAINGGLVAATFALHQAVAGGGGAGTYGYNINGAGIVNVAQAGLSGTLNWDNYGYMPSGLTAPVIPASLLLRYTAGAGVQAKTVACYQGQVEILGQFDEADQTPLDEAEVIYPKVGPHNPHDQSPWSYNSGVAPISPVVIKSGTYVGNNGVTELTFRAPVHFMQIRRVTAAVVKGATWWSPMLAGVLGQDNPTAPESLMEAQWRPISPDPGPGLDIQEAECVVRIVGDTADVNAAGATYAYVAFMDPGMRYSSAGSHKHYKSVADRTDSFFKPTFQAEAAFIHLMTMAALTSVAMYFKGPGHAANTVQRYDNVVLNDAVALPVGGITFKDAFMTAEGGAGDDAPYIAFRNDDGSADPGRHDVVKIVSWIGDGAASRTIALPNTTKRPLWAHAAPNGAQFFRDPQMTGTTSYTYSTGNTIVVNAATGITAGGPGSVTVGSALNANGVAHSMFVIMGGTVAGNNGWSADGEFIPVEPIAPADWPGDGPPIDDDDDIFDLDDDDTGGGGGDSGDGGGGEPTGDDFGTQCITASTKVCNVALSHIGVNEPLVNVTTDTTPEASQCRLHYEDSVNESLREFPWDFATRYASLVKVAGTTDAQVNDDWVYSYRLPTDLIFPRRLVRPEKRRAFDPDPPPFRQTGADATGRLLLSNWRDPDTDDDTATATLEYTYRPNCAAGQGDALYRSALAWLLASKLAPSLARNKVTAADAYRMFLQIGNRASTVNARAQQQEPNNGDAEWIRGR